MSQVNGEIPVKRGRGRPRKHPLPQQPAAIVAAEPVEIVEEVLQPYRQLIKNMDASIDETVLIEKYLGMFGGVATPERISAWRVNETIARLLAYQITSEFSVAYLLWQVWRDGLWMEFARGAGDYEFQSYVKEWVVTHTTSETLGNNIFQKIVRLIERVYAYLNIASISHKETGELITPELLSEYEIPLVKQIHVAQKFGVLEFAKDWEYKNLNREAERRNLVQLLAMNADEEYLEITAKPKKLIEDENGDLVLEDDDTPDDVPKVAVKALPRYFIDGDVIQFDRELDDREAQLVRTLLAGYADEK